MSTYLDSFEIDWGWPRLSKAQRAIARRHEARFQADPHRHTLETFTEALAEASRQLKGHPVHALVADFEGEYELLAKDGDCDESHEKRFDPAGTCPEVLTAKDFRAAGVDQVAISLTGPSAPWWRCRSRPFASTARCPGWCSARGRPPGRRSPTG